MIVASAKTEKTEVKPNRHILQSYATKSNYTSLYLSYRSLTMKYLIITHTFVDEFEYLIAKKYRK